MSTSFETKTERALPLTAAVLAIIGVTIFLYPQAAQWVSQYRHAQIVNAYSQIVQNVEPSQSKQLNDARKYNETLAGGGLVDIAGHVPTLSETNANIRTPEQVGLPAYENQLRADNSGLMGRIVVKVADIDLPIYHGTDDFTLLRGAGHLQGTALPVGGVGTRSVITAHRGLADVAMFTNLDRVQLGDEFIIEVFGEVLVYKVFNIEVVEPDDSSSIRPIKGRDLATLITCTPLGINTQRIVITGERILPTPQDAQAGVASDLPHFPWWLLWWLLTVFIAIGFYIFARPRRKDEDDEQTAKHEQPRSFDLGP